jgi:peroxiredoxin
MIKQILFGWMLVMLVSGCGGERPGPASGEPAPGLDLQRLGDGRVTLEELRGSVVAVRFWADWCPFCRREMRELEPVYQRLHDQGLEILAVNVGQNPEHVRRFVDRVGYTYPTLLDPDSALARRFGVIAIPVTYFIDREGIVRGKIIGESDAATFERMALPLLRSSASAAGSDPPHPPRAHPTPEHR